MISANWNPSRRTLRQFAGALVVLSMIIGGVSGASPIVWTLFLFGFAGLAYSPLVKPAFLAMTVVTYPIGLVLSHLLLRVVYYLVLSPVALLLRVFGRDALRLRKPHSASYWESFRNDDDLESHFRQS